MLSNGDLLFHLA